MQALKFIDSAIEKALPAAEEVARAAEGKIRTLVQSILERNGRTETLASNGSALMPLERQVPGAAASRVATENGAVPLALFEKAGQGQDGSSLVEGTLLPRRRFLRSDSADQELVNRPYEEDWRMRRSELSEAIASKISRTRLAQTEYWQARDYVSQSDRPIAEKILELSASNSTEHGLFSMLSSVGNQIKALSPGPHSRFFAASPSSSGNMLAYLTRKAAGVDGVIYHFDNEKVLSNIYSGGPLFLFDEVAKLGSSERKALLEAQKTQPVAVVDVNGFDRTPNFVDFALGREHVQRKLLGLLDETKSVMREDSELRPEDAIRKALRKPFDQAVAELSAQTSQSGQPVSVVRAEPLPSGLSFSEPIIPWEVQHFFESQFEDPARRLMAAELMAENVEFQSLGGLIPRLTDLRYAIEESARLRGRSASDDIFVVAAEDGGASSDAFMTYLYGQVAGLSPDRIMTLKQLATLKESGNLGSKRIIAVDDAIYNGWQAEERLYSQFAGYPDLALATLSSYSQFARRVSGAVPLEYDILQRALSNGHRELITLQTDFSLNPELTSRFSHLTDHEWSLVKSLSADRLSDSSLASLKVFPHMTSDTTPAWLDDFARKFPLTAKHFYYRKQL